MESNNHSKGSIVKAAFFILFLVTAVVVARFTPLRDYLTAERLGQLLATTGPWAPVAFIGTYAVGVCLFLPGTLLTTIGAAIFGPYFGFIYVWIGAMLGASLSFFIGRYLGRDFAASLIGDRLRKYDEAIERNGFATVLYLRLVYFPFTPMNFGMGLTRVHFRDYFSGTALGIIVGTFIFTFFVGTLKEVWSSGQWEGLLSWKVFLSLGLFAFSFFIPKFVERLKASRRAGFSKGRF
ncbi:MAG: TVP38/TMEM64 family protein [Desulfocapsaceae bacterium]|nr:TVP38/TMEM64 family protein [Desulfocapsaceae bacterium]